MSSPPEFDSEPTSPTPSTSPGEVAVPLDAAAFAALEALLQGRRQDYAIVAEELGLKRDRLARAVARRLLLPGRPVDVPRLLRQFRLSPEELVRELLKGEAANLLPRLIERQPELFGPFRKQVEQGFAILGPDFSARPLPEQAVQQTRGRDLAPGAGALATRPAQARTRDLPARIGRYEVRARLGVGGFGTVYRAHDPQLDRDVAVKVFGPGVFSDPHTAERFQREARATVRMLHPHIVPVYDVGRHEDAFYIASAFVAGRTLAELIPAGGMEPRQAVLYTVQLVEALGYAHRQGVLHRDVKPANALVDETRGRLFLIDFGLAVPQELLRLTQAGAVLGTPAYMAPEQARGDLERIGPASDLYSAGVVLYQLLTGRLPFEGPLPVMLYNTVHTPAPPPSTHRPSLDLALDAIVLRALAKKPEERYGSGEEFSAALRTWLAGPPPSSGTRPPGPKKSEPKPPPVPSSPRPPVLAPPLAYRPAHRSWRDEDFEAEPPASPREAPARDEDFEADQSPRLRGRRPDQARSGSRRRLGCLIALALGLIGQAAFLVWLFWRR
jgi:serine/threonine protein kinase